MKARLATWNGVTAWDVSTGDPIVPQQVRPPRLHGEDILVLGYRPETTIAEKGVTILETGRHQHPLARLRRHRRWAVPSTGPRQPARNAAPDGRSARHLRPDECIYPTSVVKRARGWADLVTCHGGG